MKRFLLIVLALILSVAFLFSCSKSGPEGKYVCISVGGKTVTDMMNEAVAEFEMTMSEYLELLGMDSIEEFMLLELKPDHTLEATTMGEDDDGTWTQNGDKITMIIDGDPQDFTLKGNELTCVIDGAEYIFRKK